MISLSVDGADLRDAATWVARLCPIRGSDPILGGVLVEADSELTLSGYDKDTAGKVAIPAVVLTSGRALLSAHLFAAIAKTLDAKADVRIDVSDSEAELRVGRNRWAMPLMRIEDYPQLPEPGEAGAKLDAATLRRALIRCLPAADRTDVEPLRGCVKLETAGQELTIAALDRWRMAVATLPWDGPEIDVPVPTSFVEAMTRALAPESVAATLSASAGSCTMSSASRTLTGRLGAAEWPEWRRFLPSGDPAASATFVVAGLAAAVDRVLAVADEKAGPVRLDVGPDGFEIESVSDKSSANAEAAVSDFAGESKMLAVNPRYLRDALDTLDCDLAVLRVGERANAPLDLMPLDGDGKPVTDYRHIVMPMSVAKLQKRNR